LAGFMMKGATTPQTGLLLLGTLVAGSSVCAIVIRFSHEHKSEERRAYAAAVAMRDAANEAA